MGSISILRVGLLFLGSVAALTFVANRSFARRAAHSASVQQKIKRLERRWLGNEYNPTVLETPDFVGDGFPFVGQLSPLRTGEQISLFRRFSAE